MAIERLLANGSAHDQADAAEKRQVGRIFVATVLNAADRRAPGRSTINDMAYNKDQWIASFEGQLAILRPHLTERVLTTMSLQAWHAVGTDDADPIAAARELSKLLDQSPP